MQNIKGKKFTSNCAKTQFAYKDSMPNNKLA